MQWPQILPDWLTPELALADWQARIRRVARQTAAHLSALEYVSGVAVMGSVGRGTPMPVSDVDMFVVTCPPGGEDVGPLLAAQENKRNARLTASRIPNTLEFEFLALTVHDLQAALALAETEFVRLSRDFRWFSLMDKVMGAKTLVDPDGLLGSFIARCEGVRFADAFIALAVQRMTDGASPHLARALSRGETGNWAGASRDVHRATDPLSWGMYETWRRQPQSAVRAVTRLLGHAMDVGDAQVGEAFLSAVRLGESDTWRRFAAVPKERQLERDLWLAIRRGAGEPIDELAATRDMLQISTWVSIGDDLQDAWPEWTGVTGEPQAVRAQLDGACLMLERLTRASRELSASTQ